MTRSRACSAANHPAIRKTYAATSCDPMKRYLDANQGGVTNFAGEEGAADEFVARNGTRRDWGHCVCDDCNHHWLSDLESFAAPILAPMMKGGTRRVLNVGQCGRLAAWADTRALMLDRFHAEQGGNRIISDGVARQLFERKATSPTTIVFLGRQMPDSRLAVFELRLNPVTPEALDHAEHYDGYRATFGVRQLVVQVLWHDGSGKIVIEHPDTLVPLGPSEGADRLRPTALHLPPPHRTWKLAGRGDWGSGGAGG